MKRANKLIHLFRNARLTTLLCSIFLVSCGGGFETAGIGGTGISYGTVTGFGSVIINGSHLDDSTASVTLDDNPGVGLHGGLKQGMVVRVSGTFNGNTGTASTIEFRDNLEGPVCDAPATMGGIRTLRVLGQTVILDATTIVDNSASIDTIMAGDIVEVSGLSDNLEQIRASFIEVNNPIDAVIEVKGHVDSVNGFILTINALEVDFSGIGVIDNSIPGGVPAIGQFVEVKGTIFACGAPDTLIATRVELEPEGAGVIPTGNHAEVEGFVTTPVISNSFMIGNREVMITGSTRFLPEDFDVFDIVVGTKVEAQGTSASGVLTATKISFRENVKLQSDVDVTTISGSSPTFSFMLVGLPGIIITTNSATTGDAPVGRIRVRGIEGPNNTVLATRIDERSTQTDVFLQGAVDEINMGTEIKVLGILVETSDILDNFPNLPPSFADVDDMGITYATFLNLVQLGTLVKFTDLLAGPTITWDEAELEDD